MEAVTHLRGAAVPRSSVILTLVLTLCLGACGNGGAQRAPGPEANASGHLVYGDITFTPCSLNSASGQSVKAHCGHLEVAENPALPGTRSLELALALVTATGLAEADPVVMLAGGPGQSALESYPEVQGAFGEVLRNRHVLLLDARGTGSSNPLHCDMESADALFAANGEATAEAARLYAAQCRDALAERADLRFYTTTDHVRDLEQLRSALGVERLNLLGISYGTRVAQQYAATHPAKTRTLILDSVVPNTLVLGQEHARNLEQVLDRQFQRCQQDPACKDELGDPRAQLAQIREDLGDRAPEAVRYRDPVSGEWREEVPRFDHLAILLRLYAYQPAMAASLPLLLHEAAQGQYQSMLAQARMVSQDLGQSLAMGMSLSVTCSEDAKELQPDPRDEGTVLGPEFVSQTRAMCAEWPTGKLPAHFRRPLSGGIPVLALSGEFDPVTPPRYGDAVVAELTNARHLVLPGQGHSVMAVGCTPRLAAQFLESADAGQLDASCLEQLIAPPPYAGRFGWEP